MSDLTADSDRVEVNDALADGPASPPAPGASSLMASDGGKSTDGLLKPSDVVIYDDNGGDGSVGEGGGSAEGGGGGGEEQPSKAKKDDENTNSDSEWWHLAAPNGGAAGWLKANSLEILSGVTVALALVPEAIAFAFVAGVTPYVGLTAAWIVGLVTSIAGGRPGMISGATGALAVVMPGLVADKGPGGLFYAIMLAGVIQLCLGVVKVNRLVRLISHPVMIGFCNGLAIVIGLAQPVAVPRNT